MSVDTKTASRSLIFAKDLNVNDVFSFNIEGDTVMRKVIEVEDYPTSFSEIFIHYDFLDENNRSGGMAFQRDEQVLLVGEL